MLTPAFTFIYLTFIFSQLPHSSINILPVSLIQFPQINIMTSSWQDAAARKRESISSLIPTEWRVDNLPTVKEQVDVTNYVKQYLSEEELGITESDANQIVEKTTSGTWTAEQVTRAFCHRAALAHQLVLATPLNIRLNSNTNTRSCFAFTRSSSTQPLLMRRGLMSTSQNTRNPLGHCMVFLSH